RAAVRRSAHQHRAQGVAIHVTVVAQHAARQDVQGGVFGRAIAVVDRQGRVVDACDGDAHRGDARVGLAIIGLVSETVAAQVVGSPDVSEAPVALYPYTALFRSAHQHRAQGVAVHVTVVAQHARRAHGQGRVFVDAVTVVGGDRRVVHRDHRDRDRGNRALDRAVVG